MINAVPYSAAPDRPFVGLLAWCRARPWLGIVVVLAIWTLMPLVRRLFDWHAGFASISVLSSVPLLALLPAAIALARGRLRLLDARLAFCAWLWAGGFGFALVVALASGQSPFACAYELALFLLPAAFGLWVATLDAPAHELFERTATVLLWLSTPLCIYAILQFISPPPWDVAWMQSAKLTNIGRPFPYELRPFSTLNSPGVFADFLDVVIALNLPRLVAAVSPVRAAQFMLCVATLGLTMVRTGWLGLAVAVIVFIALTPNRLRNLSVLAAVALAGMFLMSNAGGLLGDAAATNGLTARFSTLTNLNNDYSFVDRQRYFEGLLADAMSQPLGQGLGVLGTAAKLGDGGQARDFDNGYIARFTEMGYFGMLCYLLAVGGLLAISLAAWRRAAARKSRRTSSAIAAIVAVQAMLIVLDISSDHHNALAGIACWLTIAFVASRTGPLAYAD